MKKLFNYLKSVFASNTGNSVKSFSLGISVLVGAILGLSIAYAIIYDVTTNGFLKSDIVKMGYFIALVGAYVSGSGVPKIFGEKYESDVMISENEKKEG